MSTRYLYRVDVRQDDGTWKTVRHYISRQAAEDRTLRLHDRGLRWRIVRSERIGWPEDGAR